MINGNKTLERIVNQGTGTAKINVELCSLLRIFVGVVVLIRDGFADIHISVVCNGIADEATCQLCVDRDFFSNLYGAVKDSIDDPN